jgi:hypothetical protein
MHIKKSHDPRFAMRLLTLVFLGLVGSTVSAPADERVRCFGNDCLSACMDTTGMSREECVRALRRAPAASVESVPVQPRSRSKYAPVPQSGQVQQQPGPYVNPQ